MHNTQFPLSKPDTLPIFVFVFSRVEGFLDWIDLHAPGREGACLQRYSGLDLRQNWIEARFWKFLGFWSHDVISYSMIILQNESYPSL